MDSNKVFISDTVIKIDNKPLKQDLIYLDWENINVWTPDTASCIDKIKKKPKESKHIVKDGNISLN